MALGIVRFAGNLAVAAFFSADKDKKRHEKREDYKTALGDSKNDSGAGSCLPNKSICLYNRSTAWKIRDGTESELRLLPQSVHRYAAPKNRIVHGALFAFVQGTDPDLFLLIEARGENVASARWQFADTRMTGAELRLSRRDKQVWKADLLPWSEFIDHERVYTNFIFKETPDFLKDALAKPKR